jgi:hypothetical protein
MASLLEGAEVRALLKTIDTGVIVNLRSNNEEFLTAAFDPPVHPAPPALALKLWALECDRSDVRCIYFDNFFYPPDLLGLCHNRCLFNRRQYKGRQTGSGRTLVSSPDGRTLTVTTRGTDARGQQVNTVGVYDKQ